MWIHSLVIRQCSEIDFNYSILFRFHFLCESCVWVCAGISVSKKVNDILNLNNWAAENVNRVHRATLVHGENAAKQQKSWKMSIPRMLVFRSKIELPACYLCSNGKYVNCLLRFVGRAFGISCLVACWRCIRLFYTWTLHKHAQCDGWKE